MQKLYDPSSLFVVRAAMFSTDQTPPRQFFFVEFPKDIHIHINCFQLVM